MVGKIFVHVGFQADEPQAARCLHRRLGYCARIDVQLVDNAGKGCAPQEAKKPGEINERTYFTQKVTPITSKSVGAIAPPSILMEARL